MFLMIVLIGGWLSGLPSLSGMMRRPAEIGIGDWERHGRGCSAGSHRMDAGASRAGSSKGGKNGESSDSFHYGL